MLTDAVRGSARAVTAVLRELMRASRALQCCLAGMPFEHKGI